MAAVQPAGPGRLRRRLVLEAPLETPDGAGGVVRGFDTVTALWGEVEWLRGDERWQADRPEQAAALRVTLRHRPGVDAGMRLRDGTRVFDIKAVGDPDGRRRRLVCLCEEVSR